MNELLNVLSPGQTVHLVANYEIKAVILKVCIEGPNKFITYECVWYSGTTRTTAYLQEFEIVADAPQITPIGFKIKTPTQ